MRTVTGWYILAMKWGTYDPSCPFWPLLQERLQWVRVDVLLALCLLAYRTHQNTAYFPAAMSLCMSPLGMFVSPGDFI